MSSPSLRWIAVWRRNFRVWRKLIVPSLIGNFGEPLLYVLALGYGLGGFVGTVQGIPYIAFLAPGIVCTSVMYSATMEGMYSAYTRMAVQQTWLGMLATPLRLEDIVLGEMVWAATKGLISAAAIVIVIGLMGLITPAGLWALFPVLLLAGLCFAALALAITALAKGYDFFIYYFTLVITPMFLLSGVFFPLDKVNEIIKIISNCLPLTHVVQVVRPLLLGQPISGLALHLAVLAAYAGLGYGVAALLYRRRLLV